MSQIPNNSDAFLRATVEEIQDKIRAAALDIWARPELGHLEHRSAKRLADELSAEGFEITFGLSGMPTAFMGSYGSDGPVLGIMAEYDALPEMSQDAVPYEKPLEGQPHGHACGHHLIGSAAVGAAIAVKRWLEASGQKAVIRLYGTPAEEGGAGKTFMTRDGIFDDLDICLHWHPWAANQIWSNPCLSVVSGKFRFWGRAAHAAAHPELGRSALKAAEAMNVMVNMMREHIPQESRIHYTIDKGGNAPNIVTDYTELSYMMRHPDPEVARNLMERVIKCAEGAAIGTETRMEFELQQGHFGLLPNVALGSLMQRFLEETGGPVLDAEEIEFAEAISKTLPGKVPPVAEISTVKPYDPNHMVMGSTDVGDVSWVVPTAGLFAATWVPGTAAHSWQATAAGGMTIGLKGAEVATTVLAKTAVALIQDPALIEAAKAEYRDRVGEGFTYVSLMESVKAPILDYWKDAAPTP